MFITPKWLKDHKICLEAQRQLSERFPDGADHEVIRDVLLKLSDDSIRKRRWLAVWRKKFGESTK